MSSKRYQLVINNPSLFMASTSAQLALAQIRQRTYRWKDQPFWPLKGIAFTPTDRTNRRKLIEALVADGNGFDQQMLGYQLLQCDGNKQLCGSPLCNFCRTHQQNSFEARMLKYFGNSNRQNLFWLTILNDLSYQPLTDIPLQLERYRVSVREFFKRHYGKQVRALGAFEIDVKSPIDATDPAANLLTEYGWQANGQPPYMLHLHAVVELDGWSPQAFGDELRQLYAKTKQVTVKPLLTNKPLTENLSSMARYCLKFRYQFADNILRDKPSYGSRFDDDTLLSYAALVHKLKGERGVTGFNFRYNL